MCGTLWFPYFYILDILDRHGSSHPRNAWSFFWYGRRQDAIGCSKGACAAGWRLRILEGKEVEGGCRLGLQRIMSKSWEMSRKLQTSFRHKGERRCKRFDARSLRCLHPSGR